MAPKRTSNKKALIKLAVSSADAKMLSNGEKELQELKTGSKNVANISEVLGENLKELTKSVATKRSSGRGKNVTIEVEEPLTLSKKPVTKGRGKKKSNENEVIQNETEPKQEEVQEADEVKTADKEIVAKAKRGGGSKKAEAKIKSTSASKEKGKLQASAESLKEEEIVDFTVAKISGKKVKPTVSGKRKQEAIDDTAKNVAVKEEIEEDSVEKVLKKLPRNSKKVSVTTAEVETSKKRGKSIPRDTTREKDQIEVSSIEENETKSKEKKSTKRGRNAAKTVHGSEDTIANNSDISEEVLPKKRSRKTASVEKEIVGEKPKKGRGKKTEKLADNVEKVASLLHGKLVATNGQVKAGEKEESEDIPDSNKKGKKKSKPAGTSAIDPSTKARGGRKRAAPSTNKKFTTAVEDVMNEGENNELEDEAGGSKPSKTKKKTESGLLNVTITKYNKSDFTLAPNGQTADEPRFNLKISSWNVAGLRSWLKKEGLKFLEYEEPDIFCLQETKCTTDQLPEEMVRIPGYHPYWLCMPGGYAGVAIYSKIMPINVEYGIGNKEFDDCGRIITAEYEKFFLINVYVPNSGRKLVNLDARMKWEKIFQGFVQNLDARKPVVICGDMNVSHQEIDLANPKTNTRNAGFTKEERDKMTELLKLGYIDTFRHLYPDRKGAYTFWSYMGNARSRNVGWRLDYFIVSERFIKRVIDNCIRSQCMGSDHCPITLFLKL